MQVAVVRDLGLAVRGRRLELGESQTALSARAGVSRKWLSEFEQGKPTAEIGIMLRVLDALQMRLTVEPRDHQEVTATLAYRVDLDDLLRELDTDGEP
ncbi:MAG: helix-turn-helix domain-containing protein [Nitriliruptoraceae bacterium]